MQVGGGEPAGYIYLDSSAGTELQGNRARETGYPFLGKTVTTCSCLARKAERSIRASSSVNTSNFGR